VFVGICTMCCSQSSFTRAHAECTYLRVCEREREIVCVCVCVDTYINMLTTYIHTYVHTNINTFIHVHPHMHAAVYIMCVFMQHGCASQTLYLTQHGIKT
jgi:hypothetical protein